VHPPPPLQLTGPLVKLANAGGESEIPPELTTVTSISHIVPQPVIGILKVELELISCPLRVKQGLEQPVSYTIISTVIGQLSAFLMLYVVWAFALLLISKKIKQIIANMPFIFDCVFILNLF
jgi:hypothetical protein